MFRLKPLWCFLCLMSAALAAQAAAPGVQVRSLRGEFADIRERVVIALQNRGLVVSYTARVGDMLERTGRDLGRNAPVYGNAEVLEFCSAVLSREAMEADPHSIVYCPYAIAVYTLPGKPGTVYLSYRAPAAAEDSRAGRALRAVGSLLAGIVDEAMN